ncbi:MAG: LysM peptidoglycan-binding domain-containing protein [Anaerolineales bacterium]|nr:LysM peptidoglycan-binding domain-containing protein [Anaerolineales bacterium]
MRLSRFWVGLLLVAGLALMGLWASAPAAEAQTGGTPSRTPSLTRTHSPTRPTRTPTLTRTPSPSRTPLTPIPSETSAFSPTPTHTETATSTGPTNTSAPPTTTRTPTRDSSVTPGGPTRTATLVPGPATYTVQPGDTLAKIAEKFGVRLADLLRVNNLTLDSQIFAGQILLIPPRPPTATRPPLTVPPGYTTYTVKQGDQLLLIARQFRITVPALRTANNLSTDTIYPGQVLLIPPPSTPTRTRTPFPPNATIYVVQPGDQLLRIARKFGVPLSQLKAANGLSSDTIQPGRQLLIPTRLPATVTRTPSRTPTGVFITYTVKAGDRLWRIATWYGITLKALRDANGLSGDTLRVGQVLTIPNPTRRPIEYVVQPGDTLTSIAARFDTTVLKLQISNGMGEGDTIFAGLKLIVPAKP